MCWFAENLFDDIGPCDGPVDRCHLIPKQRIRREFSGCPPLLVEEAVWHPAVWVEGCRRHHDMHDNYRLRIPRRGLPERLLIYARVMGLEHLLDRDYR